MTKTTVDTLSVEQIEALANDSFTAGDKRMTSTCDELLDLLDSGREHKERAIKLKEDIVAAINAAEAQS